VSEYIIDITPENAQQVVIDGSFEQLVVVDFWADWCAPCKALMPILEKLATEYQGQFVLAKVNADEQQALAGQFGVRSLPTVMFIKEGKPVDGFTGAQTEPQVREILAKHLPSPWAGLIEQATEHQQQGEHDQALPLLRDAYQQSSQQVDIAKMLIANLIELNRCDEAQALLDTITMVDQDAVYQQLVSQLELKREAARSPEIEALEKQWGAEPNNVAVACQLAVKLSEVGQHNDALALLLTLLKRDINIGEGEAKKIFLDVIATLGKGDPLAIEYQRKFFTLLY